MRFFFKKLKPAISGLGKPLYYSTPTIFFCKKNFKYSLSKKKSYLLNKQPLNSFFFFIFTDIFFGVSYFKELKTFDNHCFLLSNLSDLNTNLYVYFFFYFINVSSILKMPADSFKIFDMCLIQYTTSLCTHRVSRLRLQDIVICRSSNYLSLPTNTAIFPDFSKTTLVNLTNNN